MKKFFTVKRIIYLSIVCVTLLTLILMLIFPIDLTFPPVRYYSPYLEEFVPFPLASDVRSRLISPFTFKAVFGSPGILLIQTIVFPIVGVIFLTFLTLFMVELKKAGVIKLPPRRPTKVQQLEARIAELEKQAAERQDEE